MLIFHAMIYNSITQAVGNTPIVQLQRIGAELDATLLVKCEFMNPGGSIKDRIAFEMVEQAEREGRIKPGDTLIEPTSGNTGVGLAVAGAARGYQIIITMPEKMSHEKQVVLEALGAKIYRTPTEAAWDSEDSHISLAKRLEQELPNAHILDQYANPNNPGAHYRHTAEEILHDVGDDLSMVVMGVGTGGTISGVGRRLKETLPNIQVIGVDPVGSILGGGTEVGSYEVEGIGYDFFPDVLDNTLVDEYVKTQDRESLLMARRLICDEGLLVGGSSGAAVWAALQVAARLKSGERCLILLPDSIRNYLTKFADDRWMVEQGYIAS